MIDRWQFKKFEVVIRVDILTKFRFFNVIGQNFDASLKPFEISQHSEKSCFTFSPGSPWSPRSLLSLSENYSICQ